MAALLPEGVYVETVSLLCRDGRPWWGMPLGLINRGGSVGFRVYRGTGYWRLLVEGGGVGWLVLAYTPHDPAEFYEYLDLKPAPTSRCAPRGRYSVLVECEPELVEAGGEAAWFQCSRLRVKAGEPAPYTRAYGCLVELAVLETKARAGVVGCDAREYASWLRWCVRRSAPAAAGFHGLAERAVRTVEEALSGRC